MKVIDISEHNGKIDFKKVKADGIDGVIIRAGYGKGNVDKLFTSHITGAIKAGLHIGIYWFSYAYTAEMAKREAHFCNDIIAPYFNQIDLGVYFDWEYDSMDYAKKNNVDADKKLITKMTKAFCEEITNLRYRAGYYLNMDYAKNYYDESQLKDYKRWYARYIKTPQKNCDIWQSSSSGIVKGINGKVDMDTLWGDLSDFEPNIGISSPKQKKTQEKAPNESQRYIVGKTYSVGAKKGLNVRRGAGKEFPLVGHKNLSADARKHSAGSALIFGTKVTCLEVKEIDSKHIWVRIPSGWICAVDNDNTFVV